MRFHLGAPPLNDNFQPEEDDWTPLREPSPLMINVLAIPFGVFAAILLALGWAAGVDSFAPQLGIDPAGTGLGQPAYAAVLFVALVMSLLGIIAAHELIHGLGYPYFGLTRSTVLGVWPSKLLFYAGYLKSLRRDRWLIVYLLPFLVLSVVPLIVYRMWGINAASQPRSEQVWAWLYFLSLLNGLFSGGDLLYVLLILLQIPRRAVLQNQGWSTWWKLPR